MFVYLLLLFLVGCQSLQQVQFPANLQLWKYSDVKLVDVADPKVPDKDIIALYIRENGPLFQLRIDFLDLVFPASQDIYILLDTKPGGLDRIILQNGILVPVEMNWDYLITIPATGNIRVINDQLSQVNGMGLLIIRDTTQDNIVISFTKNALSTISKITDVQVLVTPPNNESIIDQTDPINIDAPSPTRAKVIFEFWNTFSSSTPAATLRSWDGAHSGPLSSRHGLKYLLEGAGQSMFPVYLLDLLTPENISALDYLNVLPWIRYLIDQGILVSNGNRYISQYLNLSLKNFLGILLDSNDIYSEYYRNFLDNDYAHYNIIHTFCFSSIDEQLPDSFSSAFLKCKSRLINAALLSSRTPINLGGDFTNSFLGDPILSKQVFSYIYYHPWIQVSSASDMNNFGCCYYSQLQNDISNYNELSANEQSIVPIISEAPPYVLPKIYSVIKQLPNNTISTLAKEIFISLSQRDTKENISINNNFINQLGFIITAARWAEHPIFINACDQDLDYDGKSECILANNAIFITIDPEGGYIPFVFSIDAMGIHQVVGPTWEFVTGLSDPSLWDLSLGVRSDPGQILGAFGDSFSTWNTYTANLSENKVILTSSDLTIRKSFLLINNNLHIEMLNTKSSLNEITIPLVVDPWIRFTSGWGDKYSSINTQNGIQWGIKQGVNIDIESNSEVSIYPFNETRAALSFPENPNFDYSFGHYLPYPMALAQIHPKNILTINIQVNP